MHVTACRRPPDHPTIVLPQVHMPKTRQDQSHSSHSAIHMMYTNKAPPPTTSRDTVIGRAWRRALANNATNWLEAVLGTQRISCRTAPRYLHSCTCKIACANLRRLATLQKTVCLRAANLQRVAAARLAIAIKQALLCRRAVLRRAACAVAIDLCRQATPRGVLWRPCHVVVDAHLLRRGAWQRVAAISVAAASLICAAAGALRRGGRTTHLVWRATRLRLQAADG